VQGCENDTVSNFQPQLYNFSEEGVRLMVNKSWVYSFMAILLPCARCSQLCLCTKHHILVLGKERWGSVDGMVTADMTECNGTLWTTSPVGWLSTQPGHPFVGRRNGYQLQDGDALWLGGKAGMVRVWVTGKTVW